MNQHVLVNLLTRRFLGPHLVPIWSPFLLPKVPIWSPLHSKLGLNLVLILKNLGPHSMWEQCRWSCFPESSRAWVRIIQPTVCPLLLTHKLRVAGKKSGGHWFPPPASHNTGPINLQLLPSASTKSTSSTSTSPISTFSSNFSTHTQFNQSHHSFFP